MFLNALKPKEKELFLNLAMAVIKADGIIEDSEQEMLTAYAEEMHVSVNDVNFTPDINTSIKEAATIESEQTKRIFLVELLALSLVDGKFAEEEQNIITKVANAFGISKENVSKAVELEDAYITASSSLINFVEEGA